MKKGESKKPCSEKVEETLLEEQIAYSNFLFSRKLSIFAPGALNSQIEKEELKESEKGKKIKEF